jgi:hypothetical protein
MSAMGQLETEDVSPENQGALDVRNGKAGVIGRENLERHWENVQRPRSNVHLESAKDRFRCDFSGRFANHLGNEII